ncbi:MAG: hypothetical protein WDZ35_04035 [Crocinitomicaceae bacterium]
MTKETENIILNKEYYELSPKELETVNELVSNEEQYEEMKWFLVSTQEALAHEQIEVTPDLKKRVMAHLGQPKSKQAFRWNGMLVFLFPEEKRFYQKPAFQLSIAALLLIGFLFIYNPTLKEDNMALNQTEKDTGPLLKTEKEEFSDPESPVLDEEETVDEIGLDEVEETKNEGTTVLAADQDESADMTTFADDGELERADGMGLDGWYQAPVEETESEEIAADINMAPVVKEDEQKRSEDRDKTVTTGDNETILIEKTENTPEQRQAKKKDKALFFSSKKSNKMVSRSTNENDDAADEIEQLSDSISQNGDAYGGAVTAEEPNSSKIKGNSVSLNEIKELKQLFTVFK